MPTRPLPNEGDDADADAASGVEGRTQRAAAVHVPVRSTLADHWKKLLRAPKQAVPVSVPVFVAELNRRLRADPSWCEGTRFIVAGADDARPGGSTWEGPIAMKPLVFRIVQGAMNEFEVEEPFFSDR